MIIEVFIQNFMIQTIFTFLTWAIIKTNLYQLYLVPLLSITPYFIVSLGWFPLVMIFMFHDVSFNPNALTRFCFMPCLIKTKYVPLLFIIISFLLTPD